MTRLLRIRVLCEDSDGSRTVMLIITRLLRINMGNLRILGEHVLQYVTLRLRRTRFCLRQQIERRARGIDLNDGLRQRGIRCDGARQASIL